MTSSLLLHPDRSGTVWRDPTSCFPLGRDTVVMLGADDPHEMLLHCYFSISKIECLVTFHNLTDLVNKMVLGAS